MHFLKTLSSKVLNRELAI